MHQQINLYQPVFRKQQKVFSALTLLQICAAVLVLLLLIAGHTRWTLNGMQGTEEALQAQLGERRLLLQQFDQLVVTERSGFAGQFRALAEIHLPGLWLEAVSIDDESRIEIRGVTLDARLVPRFLQLLDERDNLSRFDLKINAFQHLYGAITGFNAFDRKHR